MRVGYRELGDSLPREKRFVPSSFWCNLIGSFQDPACPGLGHVIKRFWLVCWVGRGHIAHQFIVRDNFLLTAISNLERRRFPGVVIASHILGPLTKISWVTHCRCYYSVLLLLASSLQSYKFTLVIMVCVACFVVPAFLYIWHRWLQPWLGPFITKLLGKPQDKVSESNASSSTATTTSTDADQLQGKMKCPFSSSKVILIEPEFLQGRDHWPIRIAYWQYVPRTDYISANRPMGISYRY